MTVRMWEPATMKPCCAWTIDMYVGFWDFGEDGEDVLSPPSSSSHGAEQSRAASETRAVVSVGG